MPNLVLRFGKAILVSLVIPHLVFMTACGSRNPLDVNVSSVEIESVKIKRYEQALFNLEPDNLRADIEPYTEEFRLFLGDEIDSQAGQQQLYEFITDPFIISLYDDAMNVWGDVARLESDLTMAMKYLRYHFPGIAIPEIYSYVSGMNHEYPVYYESDAVVLGLDMFLGADYNGYDKIGIPAFKRQRYLPEMAKIEVMRSIAESVVNTSGATLLDQMIYHGKVLYFLDAMFPHVADSLKIFYTSSQMEWAVANEGQSWVYLVNNELLYSTDRQVIQKFTGDAPFTAPFSNESSPRMSSFLGWQIVRAYMQRNSISVEDLMTQDLDSRQLLVNSRYRPD